MITRSGELAETADAIRCVQKVPLCVYVIVQPLGLVARLEARSYRL